MKRITLNTNGMECHSCEKRIEAAVKKLDGIISTRSDYAGETTTIEYEEASVTEHEIKNAIEKEGYRTSVTGASERFGNFAIALGIFTLLIGAYLLFRDRINLDFSNISMEAGFAALFVLGFLTGFHCIGMCGGFVLSYSKNINKFGDFMPHALYASGKTISYTIGGALFGMLGSFIAFTTELRAGVAIFAGIFLVIYGLNMLNIFPVLRRLQLHLPVVLQIGEREKKHGPLYTGLLNGLMIACGPLQALYIFAAGTGSAIAGAQALFFFGLGTLAPLLVFGIASNFLSATISHNVVRFSGVLVIVMGLLMASNGLNLLGVGLPAAFPANNAAVVAITADITVNKTNNNIGSDGYQVIKMDVTSRGFEPNSFVLKKGIPVKWEINARELNGCNNEIVVREYGLDIKLKNGMQTVAFTPQKEGTVRWSCWMGMLQGQFVVVNDADSVPAASVPAPPRGGSCGGGCGCGGSKG